MSKFVSTQERLPRELYYEFIIPYSLSDYLHDFLVHDKKQDWNPFLQLPLVCRHFHSSCQTLTRTKIFDVGVCETDAEATKKIRRVLRSTRKVWKEGRKIPLSEPPTRLPVQSTYQNLMSSQSLIQIYVCAGYAKYFYTIDVLCPISLDRLWITNWIGGEDVQEDGEVQLPDDFRCRPYSIQDDSVHHVFLPFTCAMVMCDSINHDALTSTVAGYLAEKSVTYGTEPMLLKHAQDLEMNIAKRHGLPLCVWSKWTKNTLKLIRERRKFLKSLQTSGTVVSAHVRRTDLNWQIINSTRILDVLRVVSSIDWGDDTESIKQEVSAARDSLLKACARNLPYRDESDEYFMIEEDKPVFYSQLFRLPVRKPI